MWVRFFLLGFLLILVLLAGFLVKTYWDLGPANEIESIGEGACRPVLGLESSEDIVIDPVTGTAYISSFWRRNPPGMEIEGAVYRYQIGRDELPANMTRDLEFSFHPLGLGLFSSGNDQFLFVVNRQPGNNCVEKFRIQDSELIHQESICRERFHSANDVLPISEQEFYLTNEHGSRTQFGRWLEDMTGFGTGEVLYFDGFSSRRVARGISYANGIDDSPEGSIVYVAASRAKEIKIYRSSSETRGLTLEETLELNTGVDNLNVDSQGTIWVAAHPDLLAFLEYSRNPSVLSPSQVLRIDPMENGSFNVSRVYESDGEYLSGSSVAAVWEDRLLIGSAFDQRFLECRINGEIQDPITDESQSDSNE
jgi:arylesterase/paraoxonase